VEGDEKELRKKEQRRVDPPIDKDEDGKIKWDICPSLTRAQRRAWKKMLATHRRGFSGPEERLGKADSKYDMTIDADAKAI
jgi:hypothetical protein